MLKHFIFLSIIISVLILILTTIDIYISQNATDLKCLIAFISGAYFMLSMAVAIILCDREII
jgi:hypothetical protein